MKLMRIAIVIFPCFLTAMAEGSQEDAANSRVLYVSFVDLIIRPQELPEGYDQISVVGYLTEASGQLELYLSEGHAELLDPTSSMVVELPGEEFLASGCLNNYVRVTGFFEPQPPGFLPTIVKLMKVEKRHEDKGFFHPMPRDGEAYLDLEEIKKLDRRRIPLPCWERGEK